MYSIISCWALRGCGSTTASKNLRQTDGPPTARGSDPTLGSDAIGHPDIEKTTLSAVLPMAYATRTGGGNITRGAWPGTFHPTTSPTHSPATRSGTLCPRYLAPRL